MIISILCSSTSHPIMPSLLAAVETWQRDHTVSVFNYKKDLPGGDILFLVSCTEIITSEERAKYGSVLVLHASPLPIGRGWSPHIWAIVEGAEEITLSLIEAEDKVDTGRIWLQTQIPIAKHLIWNEINEALFAAEIALIDTVLRNRESITPIDQPSGVEPTYYRKRTPADSEIDASLSLAGQFDKIRVCDPNRFPAFFRLFGHVYRLKLERIDDANDND